MTAQADEDYRNNTSGKRLALFTLIFILMTAAGLYAVYDQFAGRTFSFDTRLLSPGTLVALAALLLVYFTADGLRLYFTLRALGHSIPLPVITRLVFINLFFSNVTPMATGGGFAQVWYLHNHGVPLGRATAATTIRTVLAVIFIFSLTPIFLLTLDAFKGETLAGNLGPVLAVLILLYLGFFMVVLFRTRWLIGPLSRLLWSLRRAHLLSEARHRRWQFKARREMLRFSVSFGHYLRGPKLFVGLSVLFTSVFLLSLFSFPAILINALDYDVDYLISLGLLVVTTFVMYFAPTPGASGISEGVFGSFFKDSLTSSHLVLVTVAWRFITIYIGMLIGLVIIQRGLLKKRKDPK